MQGTLPVYRAGAVGRDRREWHVMEGRVGGEGHRVGALVAPDNGDCTPVDAAPERYPCHCCLQMGYP